MNNEPHKLSCNCKHDGKSYCACGAPVCMEHNNVNGEVECDRCTEDTKRLKRGQEEVAELAKMTGANKPAQIVEKIKYLDRVVREGFSLVPQVRAPLLGANLGVLLT